MPPKVLLDTNVLMMAARLGRDLMEEIATAVGSPVEYVVPSFVVEELRNLVERESPSVSRQAQFALKLAERCKMVEASLKQGVDESIVKLAKSSGFVVATCDGKLRKKLREKGIAVVYPRDNFFVLELSLIHI